MKLIKKILIEILVILGFYIFWYWAPVEVNSPELTNGDTVRALFHNENLASLMTLFGITWFVLNIFIVTGGAMGWLANTALAIGFVIFGITWESYGFFHAIMAIGFYGFAASALLSMFNSISSDEYKIIGTLSLIIFLILTPIGYIGKNSDSPYINAIDHQSNKNREEQLGQNDPNAEWQMEISAYGNMNVYYYTGRTEMAQTEIKSLTKTWAKEKGISPEEVTAYLILIGISPSSARQQNAQDWISSSKYDNNGNLDPRYKISQKEGDFMYLFKAIWFILLIGTIYIIFIKK